jgi:zinc transporter 1/2/3
MLPSAFQSLSNPCLPDFWISTYTAAPGAIAMSAAVIIFLVEFGSARYLAYVDSHVVRDPVVTSFDSSSPETKLENGENRQTSSDHFGHHHIIPPPIEGQVDPHTAATQKLGVGILEAGIIFHSVFIGLTLAVSTGSDFISLFITIIFHRIFPHPQIKSNLRNFRGIGLGKSNRNLGIQAKGLASISDGSSIRSHHSNWYCNRDGCSLVLRSQLAESFDLSRGF